MFKAVRGLTVLHRGLPARLANMAYDGRYELAIAKQRAKLPPGEVELVVYPGRKSFYEIVRNPLGGADGAAGALAGLLGMGEVRGLQMLAAPLRVFRRGEPLAIMPNVFVR